jgi:hypothetical protein
MKTLRIEIPVTMAFLDQWGNPTTLAVWARGTYQVDDEATALDCQAQVAELLTSGAFELIPFE